MPAPPLVPNNFNGVAEYSPINCEGRTTETSVGNLLSRSGRSPLATNAVKVGDSLCPLIMLPVDAA